jgi:hypothetical protein
MADAMNYEYLLRRIYQVGRYGKKDVDADVYRSLQHAERSYALDVENVANRRPKLDMRSIEKLEYEYRVKCKEVWLILSKALKTGLEKYGNKFTGEEIEIIEQFLTEPKILTRDYLEKLIDSVEAIFVKHEIYPA